ncbi:F0F1 ATP synthase subunit delta [Candidatus Gillettellia adelgis]
MSASVTIARPYAKAVFDFACEHNALDHWQEMLEFLTIIISNQQIYKILSSMVSPETLFKIFIAICGEHLDEYGQNFIHIMSKNRRLSILPLVLKKFIELRTLLESPWIVDVFSVCPLNNAQQTRIIAVMEKRLSRKVKLNCKIDKSLLAGIIIRASDLVIDGSIRYRLDSLKDVLLRGLEYATKGH